MDKVEITLLTGKWKGKSYKVGKKLSEELISAGKAKKKGDPDPEPELEPAPETDPEPKRRGRPKKPE